jgi:hypothetical protein
MFVVVVVVVVFYRKNKIEKWVCREGKGGRVVWGLVLLNVLKLLASFFFSSLRYPISLQDLERL